MAGSSVSDARRSRVARRRVAFAAGITAFLAAIGGSAAWAYFTATATATGSLSTGSVSVSQANFNGMGAKYLPSELTKTGSFTVTNTGSVPGTATITMAAPESWASNLAIRVWPTSAGACNLASPPSSALSGSWAVPPALTPALAAGASVTYCVRTTIADWTTLIAASGSRQANPVINVSLDASGWVATAPSASHVQQTAGMYPLTNNFFDPTLSRWYTVRADADTDYCLDVSRNGGAGTAVIGYGCHANSNQRWEFLPVANGDQWLVSVRPRHAMSTRVTYSGANAVVQNAANTAAQRWYVQTRGSNRYQLVNAATGLCLSLPTTANANAAMVACDSASALLRFVREPLTYGSTSTTITLTFGGANMPAGTLQRCTNASCTTWANIADIADGATNVAFARNDTNLPNNTTSTYRIIDDSSNVLWDGIRLRRRNATVTPVGGIG